MTNAIGREPSEGIDMVPLSDWPEATAICSEGQHEVKPGEDCDGCDHGCVTPGDPACPGKE